jgi:GntR family transcriptional regulator, transcriptional repressor for pyruvate dehydrogenase complex
MSPQSLCLSDKTMPDADRVTHTARRLQQAILSGKLAPGDLLPSEREISSEMGVSRSVVREALGRLASLGLVRSVHGSGTRVEAPNNKPITTGYQILLRRSEIRLADVAAVRLPLETAIAAEAALRRTDEHLARLAAAQTALAAPRGTLEAHVNADLEFHAILAEATGNPLFGIVLTPIQELLIETRRRTLGRHGAALAHEHHGRILEAIRRGDAPAAGEAMRAHLEANYQHLTADSSPD